MKAVLLCSVLRLRMQGNGIVTLPFLLLRRWSPAAFAALLVTSLAFGDEYSDLIGHATSLSQQKDYSSALAAFQKAFEHKNPVVADPWARPISLDFYNGACARVGRSRSTGHLFEGFRSNVECGRLSAKRPQASTS